MPSIEEAKKRADEKLVKDANGDPVEFWESVRNIGRDNPTLGLYLQTIFWLICLVFLLSLFSLPAIVYNVVESKFVADYLPTTNTSDPRAIHASAHGSIRSSTVFCERQYLGYNFISKLSYGSHCSSKERTNSHYNCPASCVVDIPLGRIDDRGGPNGVLERLGDDVCKKLQPCDPDSTDPSKFIYNPEAKTSCCNYQLTQEHDDGDVPIFQFWLTLVMFLIIMLWTLIVRKEMLWLVTQADQANISTGDYAVQVGGLKEGGAPAADRKDLLDFFRHYGEVVNVVFKSNVGLYLQTEENVQQLTMVKSELELVEQDPTSVSWLYRLWLKKHGSNFSKIQAKVEHLKNEELARLSPENLQTLGEAFVIFNYEAHAKNCILDHHNSVIRVMKEMMVCKDTRCKYQGLRLTTKRAPEPSDVLWNNFLYFGTKKYLYRMLGYFLTGTILVIGLLLQYLFEGIKANEREEIRKVFVYNDITEENSSLTEEAVNYVRLRFIAAMVALVVVFVNFLITTSMKQLAEMERYETRTNMEKFSIYKLALAHLFNTVVAPLLVQTDAREWYVRGGLVEQAFFIQCLNAVVPNLLFLVKSYNIPKRLLGKHCKTQEYLDDLFLPNEVLMAERYTDVLKTFMIALMYSPILPISYPIALVALIINFNVDKYSMLRLTARPREMKHLVAFAFSKMLLVLLPIHLYVTFRVYFLEEQSAIPPLIIAVLAWVFFKLAPLKKWFNIPDLSDDAEDAGTNGLAWIDAFKDPNKLQQAQSQVTAEAQQRLQAGPSFLLRVTDATEEEGGVHATQPTPLSGPSKFIAIYAPRLPQSCPKEFVDTIHHAYDLTPLAPAIEEPLPGQNPVTGGQNTRRPHRRSLVDVQSQNKLDSNQQEPPATTLSPTAAEEISGGGSGPAWHQHQEQQDAAAAAAAAVSTHHFPAAPAPAPVGLHDHLPVQGQTMNYMTPDFYQSMSQAEPYPPPHQVQGPPQVQGTAPGAQFGYSSPFDPPPAQQIEYPAGYPAPPSHYPAMPQYPPQYPPQYNPQQYPPQQFAPPPYPPQQYPPQG